MKGRPPKAVEAKRRAGNPGKRALPEPVVVGGRPDDDALMEPPKGLPKDAKDAWREIVPTLKRVGILDVVDRMALEAMCTAYARAKQAGRAVNRLGVTTKGSTGQLRANPALAVERESFTLFLRFAEQYALTPSARTRLGLAELQRRTLAEELAADLGEPELEKVA